jgi:hypothetical protein
MLLPNLATPLVDWPIFCPGIHPINMVDSSTKIWFQILKDSEIGAMLKLFFWPALPARGFHCLARFS